MNAFDVVARCAYELERVGARAGQADAARSSGSGLPEISKRHAPW